MLEKMGKQMIKKMRIVILGVCLVIALSITLFHTSAEISQQKNLMLARDGINYIHNPTRLSSDGPWQGDYIHFGLTTNNKWRVLERSGNQLLLFSYNYFRGEPFIKFDDSSNVYETSHIRQFLINEGFDLAFPDKREQALVVPTKIAQKANTEFKDDGSHVVDEWEDGGAIGINTTVAYTNPAVNGDKLFLLSVDEITNPNYGFYRNGSIPNLSRKTPTEERYWLRSGYVTNLLYPAIVDYNGPIKNNYEATGGFFIMPAATIDTSDVLYMSSAENGKVSGIYGADAMMKISDSSTHEFKFTLHDPHLKLSLSNVKRESNTFTFDYTVNGNANNISAMLFDNNGDIVSYGRMKDVSDKAYKTGTASINVPSDFDASQYTLKVFPEQYNGDNATDYAGDAVLMEESPLVNKYSVTFKDYDGTKLKQETVDSGGNATAPSSPIREGYTFIGWDKSFTNVTDDIVITAQYKINTYTVIFQNYDGTELKKQMVKYDETAVAPFVPYREGYTFVGWSENFGHVKSDITTIAQFKKQSTETFTVIFKDYDGTELKQETVDSGGNATAPSSPIREGYTFIGWDQSFTNVTGHMEINALYEIKKYCVIFKDIDGSILKTSIVPFAHDAIAPIPPKRDGYIFIGWSRSTHKISDDIEIVALYQKKAVDSSDPTVVIYTYMFMMGCSIIGLILYRKPH